MVKGWEMAGGTSVAVVLVVGGLVIMVVVVVVGVQCIAWFSEKHCLLNAMSEGSFSVALISDLLPAGVVVVAVVVVVVGVDAAPAPAPVEGVDVCPLLQLLLLLFGLLSLSLLSPSSPYSEFPLSSSTHKQLFNFLLL